MPDNADIAEVEEPVSVGFDTPCVVVAVAVAAADDDDGS